MKSEVKVTATSKRLGNTGLNDKQKNCQNTSMELHLDITLRYLNQWDKAIKDTEVENV